jgi:hypothetical protein
VLPATVPESATDFFGLNAVASSAMFILLEEKYSKNLF